MGQDERRERVIIPTHYRAHVTEYAMADWFDKHCPNREKFLEGVPVLHEQYAAMSTITGSEADILYADKDALEAVALLVGRSVDREQSLVAWIERNHQSYPSSPEGWLSVCTAAGWLITQAYFRQLGGKGGK